MTMKWVDRLIGFASDGALKKECERRKIHPTVPTIPPAQIEREIGYQEIYDIFPKTYINPNNHVEYFVRSSLWDSKYYLPSSIDDIKRFLSWNLGNRETYERDIYDCNSFALSLWADARRWTRGITFGFVLIPGHAKNFFIDKDKKLWSVEPQSDVITPIDSTVSHFFL